MVGARGYPGGPERGVEGATGNSGLFFIFVFYFFAGDGIRASRDTLTVQEMQ